jgi:hypothetical protein
MSEKQRGSRSRKTWREMHGKRCIRKRKGRREDVQKVNGDAVEKKTRNKHAQKIR